MPKLIRLYIQQVLIGFFAAAVLVALLLWFNVANLWTLVSHSDIGLMAVGLLWLFNGIVFGAVQFGIAIMRMAAPEDDDSDAGMPARPLSAPFAARVPVKVKRWREPRQPWA